MRFSPKDVFFIWLRTHKSIPPKSAPKKSYLQKIQGAIEAPPHSTTRGLKLIISLSQNHTSTYSSVSCTILATVTVAYLLFKTASVQRAVVYTVGLLYSGFACLHCLTLIRTRGVWPPLTFQSIFFKGLHIFQIAFMTLLLGPWATVWSFERPDWLPVNPCFLLVNPIMNIAQSD